MNNSEIFDLYTDYLISSFDLTTATGLSNLLNNEISHDKITRFLSNNNFDNSTLWKVVKPTLRKVENDSGIIIIDDFVENKPYTRQNEIVSFHYDNSEKRTVKGINILNFVYHTKLLDGSDTSLPIAYEIIKKMEFYLDHKTNKIKRRSKISKNELMRERLKILSSNNQIKYSYVVFDSWYSSKENFNFIVNDLKKDFVGAIKNNRSVALSYEDKLNNNFVAVSELNISPGVTRLVYLKGITYPVLLAKLTFKNGSDGKARDLYVVSSDTQLSYRQLSQLYKRRWRVEEYHKSLKQNASLEKSPTKKIVTQSNHIFCSIVAFLKLEKIKLKTKTNHFRFKNMIYIKAIKNAYKELLIHKEKYGLDIGEALAA